MQSTPWKKPSARTTTTEPGADVNKVGVVLEAEEMEEEEEERVKEEEEKDEEGGRLQETG